MHLLIGTLRDCLDFTIDWHRLYSFLTNQKWDCTGVFFYKGYKGDAEKEQLENMLEKEIGYTIRIKPTHIHKDVTTKLRIACTFCNKAFDYIHTVKGDRKSNCDVELAVDALETLQIGDRALIFTGDGDFSYLIETLLKEEITVYLVSSQKPNKLGNYRFSTRLKQLLKKEGESNTKLFFLDIERWKSNIQII